MRTKSGATGTSVTRVQTTAATVGMSEYTTTSTRAV
jgi:hypothetical protein